jgi:ClpP class serine protease
MTKHTIASLFAATDLAICAQSAQALLCLPMPKAETKAVTNAAMIARGERFAISRGVAVVPVKGLLTPNLFILERWLGWATYQGLEDTLNLLASNEEVSAVVLEFDTPGGMVLGCEAAGAAIAACAKIKPVHALVNPLCASAGYWLACSATEITATAGSLVGSIGTMRGAYAAEEPFYEFRSSHAQAKNPDPSTDEGKAEIQTVLDLAEAKFHQTIAAGRNIPLAELPARISATDDPKDGGRAFEVDDAVARGLIDKAETRDAFYARVFSKYGPKPRRAARRALMAKAKAAQAIAAT